MLQKTKLWLGPELTKPELHRRFELYLHQELLPKLDCPKASATLLERKINPLVCRIDREDGSSLAVRCFVRRMGKEKSREHLEISQLLCATGVDVPNQVLCDAGLHTIGRYGFDVAVEEWLAGRHPAHCEFSAPDSSLLKRAARLVANMHRQSANRAGTPWSKRHAGSNFIERSYTSREADLLNTIAASDSLNASAADLSRVRKQFDKHRAALDNGPPYSLVHGDLQNENLVLRPAPQRNNGKKYEESLALIDFGTVHYGLWPRDFVLFHFGCSGADLETTRRLLIEYVNERPEASAEYFLRVWPYLLVWHTVEKTASAIRKYQRTLSGRRPDSDLDYFRRRAALYWEHTLEALAMPQLL